MGLINALSDYGSGASMDSMSPWSSWEQTQWPSFNDHTTAPAVQREKRPRSSSYLDLVVGGTMSTWDARQEFQTNGTDCSYVEEDRLHHQKTPGPSGFGGRFRALRQTSCPERIPETKTRPVSWLPSPTAQEFIPHTTQHHHTKDFHQEFLPNSSIDLDYHQSEFKKDYYDDLDMQINNFRFPALDDPFPPPKKAKNDLELPMEVDVKTVEAPFPWVREQLTPLAASTPIDYQFTHVAPRAIRGAVGKVAETTNDITSEQLRILSSLPDGAVEALLRQLRAARELPAPPPPQLQPQPQQPPVKRRNADQLQECRFCKNNGERESYYQSHCLKDARGRVACPVLRAYVCSRCGATGSRAHTAKYCPMASTEERMKSAAMMRSVRNASNRRRSLYASSNCPSNLSYDQSSNQSSNLYEEYVLFGEPPRARLPPLDPSWLELEKKLSGLISS